MLLRVAFIKFLVSFISIFFCCSPTLSPVRRLLRLLVQILIAKCCVASACVGLVADCCCSYSNTWVTNTNIYQIRGGIAV